MKKFIAIAIAVLTVFSFTTVAFAESTTTLTTTVPDAEYTLNIPADQKIDFGATSTNIGNVTVTNASGFAVGKDLEVTIEYTEFACPDTTTTIPYTLVADYSAYGYDNETVTIGSGDALTFKGNNDGEVDEAQYTKTGAAVVWTLNNISTKITSANWGKALAGDYTATITFTAEVVAA